MIDFSNPEEIERITKKMQTQSAKRKKDYMTKPRQWPRPGTVKKRWECHGLDCVVAMGNAALVAYIRIPKDHPFYGQWYDDVPLQVHGGLTYCCLGLNEEWWIGWDYAHYNDWWGMAEKGWGMEHTGEIWTVDDVAKEVEEAALAVQLAASQ